MSNTPVQITRANLADPRDAEEYRLQLAAYIADPMGNGKTHTEGLLQKAVSDLSTLAHARLFIARMDEQAVGFATCFCGYSTFTAAPLWNIHDIAVLPEHRGKGIGRDMLESIAQAAKLEGCCKLTLEVREDNPTAQRLYARTGFQAARIAAKPVQYLFLEKAL